MKILFRTFYFRLVSEIFQSRTKFILCLVCLYTFALVSPVAEVCRDFGVRTPPFVYPHLLGDYRVQLVFLGLALAFFSACPFRDDGFAYLVGRCGIRKWNVSNILYIIVAAFLINCLILLSSVLALGSQIIWNNDWGQIYGTLARTALSYQYEIQFACSDYIIGTSTPVTALVLSFFLTWIGLIWCGLLIYYVNSLFNNSAGCIVVCGFLLLDIMIANSANPYYYLFSPITLARLSTYTIYYAHYHLNIIYGMLFFIVGSIMFIILSDLLYQRRELL